MWRFPPINKHESWNLIHGSPLTEYFSVFRFWSRKKQSQGKELCFHPHFTASVFPYLAFKMFCPIFFARYQQWSCQSRFLSDILSIVLFYFHLLSYVVCTNTRLWSSHLTPHSPYFPLRILWKTTFWYASVRILKPNLLARRTLTIDSSGARNTYSLSIFSYLRP